MALTPNDGDDLPLADINVTPLVDVMLVLLIIFMVAAPMLHQGLQVTLPRAQAQPLPTEKKEPVVLTLTKEGMVFYEKTPIHPSQLGERLLPLIRARAAQGVFLKADKDVTYGRVMELLDVLRQGGLVDVGLVTEAQGVGEAAKARERRP
ncbi:MAG: ExbD/TolR family protein [Thermoanaerobaculia bacterium]